MKVDNCKINADGVKIQESKRWAQVYTARWIIDTDGVIGPLRVQQDARNPAVNGTPVPAKGAAFSVGGETDFSSFAQDFNWQRVAGKPTQWTCDVTWRPLDPAEGGSPGNIQIKNPLERPPTVWWEFDETTEVVKYADVITDLSHVGRPVGSFGPIVNAAGVTFDQLPERPKSIPVLVMQRAFPDLTSIRVFHNAYIHSLNKTEYLGAAPGTLFVKRLSSSQQMYEDNKSYYLVQVHLAYDPGKWKFELVNQGLTWYDSTVADRKKRLKTILDPDGDPIKEPKLLTLTGGILEDDKNGETVEYSYAVEVDFSKFDQGLPP